MLIFAALMLPVVLSGQSDKKYIRKGNREYDDKKYSEAEILYRKAADKNKQSAVAGFNVGDALYRQNKYEEAGKQFLDYVSHQENKLKKSESFYNLGNSLLKANKLKESIEAYKSSLKLKPDNIQAKYNLAYAQDLLQEQQQQQQQQQKQNQDNKDQDKDKNKQNNKNQNDSKDQKEQKDNKDQGGKDNQDQNKQNKGDQNQDKGEQKQGISKDDAERLLNALANDEKSVQEKVKLSKASNAKVKTVKNW